MRVAVCLSGFVRSYERCFEPLKKHVIDPYGADVFIHTWTKTDRDGTHETDQDHLCELYRPEKMWVEDQDVVASQFAPPEKYAGWGNQTCRGKPMFYGISRAMMITTVKGVMYDWYVRCRFDLAFHKPLVLPDATEPDALYLPEWDDTSVNDMFAYGRFWPMLCYASCFHYMDQCCDEGAVACNEGILRHHLSHSNWKLSKSSIGYGPGEFEIVR